MFACNKKKLVMNKRARDSLVTRFNGNIMPYMTRTCHRSLLFRVSTGLFKISRQMDIFLVFECILDSPDINSTVPVLYFQKGGKILKKSPECLLKILFLLVYKIC